MTVQPMALKNYITQRMHIICNGIGSLPRALLAIMKSDIQYRHRAALSLGLVLAFFAGYEKRY